MISKGVFVGVCVPYLSVSGSSRLGVVSEHGQRPFLVHQILIWPTTQKTGITKKFELENDHRPWSNTAIIKCC